MTPLGILLVLTAYVALLFLVAACVSRRSDNGSFFTGNRRMAWGWVALGMIGAPMSGVSFVSVPGSVSFDHFTYLQMVAGFTVGQCVVAAWLVPLFYRLKVTSLYQYLEIRFGSTTQHVGATLFLISKLTLTALKLYAVCLVLQQLVCDPLGIPFAANVAGCVALVWGYTRRGGVRSVVWTDVLQTLCLVGAVLVCLVAIPHALGEGIGESIGAVWHSPQSQIFCFDPHSQRSFWRLFVAGIFILVAMTGLDQDMMQRNLSCPSARDAQKNILLTALCQAVVITLLLLLGGLLYRYAATTGVVLPEKSDGVFAAVAVNGGLPLGVGILFLWGLASSTFSTAGSALTALTTSFVYDLCPTPQRLGEKQLTRLRHRTHSLLALGIFLLVLLLNHTADESLINLVYRVVSYTYGPILGLFAFGQLTRRPIRQRGVWPAVLGAPVLSFLLQKLLNEQCQCTIGFELILYNTLFTLGALYLLSKRDEK